MPKQRLDQAMAALGLVFSRSQADSYIRLGKVRVNGQLMDHPEFLVDSQDSIQLDPGEQYVSRAALKLASVAEKLHLDFINTTVLDVGSSTGGFTDYALRHGAAKVIAVESGTNQLHPSLRGHASIELHEQTDIRTVRQLSHPADIVLIDVSFISLRAVLPHIATLCSPQTLIVAMVKPQFEAEPNQKHKGIIKNDRMRRDILQAFEVWAKPRFVIKTKADSDVAGAKGNQERFYLLAITSPVKHLHPIAQ